MEMSDFTWQHQKYAKPEIYVRSYVLKKNVEQFNYSNKNPYSCLLSSFLRYFIIDFTTL